MDKNQIFKNMLNYIENYAEDGIIKNKDGRVGKFILGGTETTYIICNNKKTYYDINEPLENILKDGWILE